MGFPRGVFDLARLLAPIQVSTFRHEYWEATPLIISRDDPQYFQELLSLQDVDEILSTSSLRSTDIRLVRDGHESSLNKQTVSGSPALRLEQVYAEYREGSTIVLQFIHERWHPLMKLVSSLSAELSAGFQVNAYLTPRNSAGLGLHYDSHDVFVLQVAGSKHWRLFEPVVRLPLRGQPYQRDKLTSARQLQEFDLKAGDLLYLPRGFIHEATSSDETSLHLTVGVLPITWAEVILASVEAVIERNVRFRESLPPGFAMDETVGREAGVQLAERLNLLFGELSPQAMVSDAIEKASLTGRPVLDGHLLDLEAEPFVDLGTLLRRRPEVQWRLSSDDEAVLLYFHGKKLRMPNHVEPDLRFIGETDKPFTGSSLPGILDEQGRLVLIRRLLREGFLAIAAL